MKKRIISAVIALAIVIPLLIIGGSPYKVGVLVLGFIGMIEIINAKKNKKKVPLLIAIISILNFLIVMLFNIETNDFKINIPLVIIIINILTHLLPLIFYHDDKKYNVSDALFFIGSSLLLSIGFCLLMCIREYNANYLIFILIVTFMSDTFAYFVGMLIGRHKLSPTISPNKSVEGFVGGLVFSTFITTTLYLSTFEYNGNILYLILSVMLLSIMSTLGDLIFSSIKRYFDIKDFGKIMPGHGGVLDRLDSLLFVLLAFYMLISIL